MNRWHKIEIFAAARHATLQREMEQERLVRFARNGRTFHGWFVDRLSRCMRRRGDSYVAIGDKPAVRGGI